jgi:hypothetical protein
MSRSRLDEQCVAGESWKPLLTVDPTPEQEAELQRLKAYYPYRIVYGALSATGQWQCGAVPTMREPNRLVRAGWRVWKAQ